VNPEQLEQFARQAGCDVLGVASIDRFGELPPDKHPRAIFPEAASVVVVGRRIPRGALRGVEEGTNFTNYNTYGDDWLDNRFTSLVTYRVAEFLEEQGWEAVPLPNLPPEVPPLGVAVAADRPAPNVMLDLVDAAVRAGVGEIGYCGVLLTPRFGPRQRIQMILTDAPLESSPLLDKPICPRSRECRGHCPLGAITGEKDLAICGRSTKVADLVTDLCRSCKNGAKPNRWHPAGKPDRLAAYCIRSCVDFLEKSGRIENRFATPFRSRPAWTVKTQADLYRI
jgi:epoxyqueuosine reductase QueG